MLKFLMLIVCALGMFTHHETQEWDPELVKKNLHEIEVVRNYVEMTEDLDDVDVVKDDEVYTYSGLDSNGHTILGVYSGSLEYAEEWIENSKTNNF